MCFYKILVHNKVWGKFKVHSSIKLNKIKIRCGKFPDIAKF